MSWANCAACGRVINWFQPLRELDVVEERAGLVCLDCVAAVKEARRPSRPKPRLLRWTEVTPADLKKMLAFQRVSCEVDGDWKLVRFEVV